MAVGQAVLPAVSLAAAGETGGDGNIYIRLAATDNWRTNSLAAYSVQRRYTLSHGRSATPAQLLAQLDYSYPGHKSFRVISETNCDYLESTIFHRVMEAEVRAARDDIRDKTKILPRNYDFDLLGTAQLDGRSSYVIRVIPKRKERFLVNGKIWVDARDAAVARLEGEAAAGSFWVRGFHILQRYERVGPYWLVAFSRNDANVRFVGTARLDIESFDYRLRTG
jgi:hypothetical protein